MVGVPGARKSNFPQAVIHEVIQEELIIMNAWEVQKITVKVFFFFLCFSRFYIPKYAY